MKSHCKKYPCSNLTKLAKQENKIVYLALQSESTHMADIDLQSRAEMECNLCLMKSVLEDIEEGKTEKINSNKDIFMICNLFFYTEIAYHNRYVTDVLPKSSWWGELKKKFRHS